MLNVSTSIMIIWAIYFYPSQHMETKYLARLSAVITTRNDLLLTNRLVFKSDYRSSCTLNVLYFTNIFVLTIYQLPCHV